MKNLHLKKFIKNPARKAVTFSEYIISGEDFLGTIFAQEYKEIQF